MDLWTTFWRNWFWPVIALCILYFAMMVWPGNKWDSIENDVVRLAQNAVASNGFDNKNISVTQRGRDLVLTGNVVSQAQKEKLVSAVEAAADSGGRIAPRVVSYDGTIEAPVVVIPKVVVAATPEIVEQELVVEAPVVVLSEESQACQQRLLDLMNTTNIYFATSKADIEIASFETLDEIANVLLQCPDANIEVAGHTDSAGEDAFNLTLSEKRAESVASYLRSQRSLKNKIYAVGYGETMPIADNSTASGQAQNRRIQFIVK